MDTTPVLHHFLSSPFSEKVRLMLGFKGLDWRSVLVPAILPKPDVVALTGGYRRTPFLQIGADIYCDSALVARVLERLQPAPTLFPASAPLAVQFAQWADSQFFWTVIPYCMQPAGLDVLFAGMPPEARKAFAVDRAPFTAAMVRKTVPDATVQLQAQLAAFEAQLADGRAFLFGGEPSIADFSLAHGLWYLRRVPPLAGVLAPHAKLGAWFDRVTAFGHGRHEPMTSAEAIALAAASTPAATAVEPGLGYDAGLPVTVMATDYGRDPVPGTLVGLTAEEVVIERIDERAGRVHVHFPRDGFQLKEQKEQKA